MLLVIDLPRGRPFGGGGVHRNELREWKPRPDGV